MSYRNWTQNGATDVACIIRDDISKGWTLYLCLTAYKAKSRQMIWWFCLLRSIIPRCLEAVVSNDRIWISAMPWSGKPQNLRSLGCVSDCRPVIRIQISDPGIAAVAGGARQIRPSVATLDENLSNQWQTVSEGFRSCNVGWRGYLVVLKCSFLSHSAFGILLQNVRI